MPSSASSFYPPPRKRIQPKQVQEQRQELPKLDMPLIKEKDYTKGAWVRIRPASASASASSSGTVKGRAKPKANAKAEDQDKEKRVQQAPNEEARVAEGVRTAAAAAQNHNKKENPINRVTVVGVGPEARTQLPPPPPPEARNELKSKEARGIFADREEAEEIDGRLPPAVRENRANADNRRGGYTAKPMPRTTGPPPIVEGPRARERGVRVEGEEGEEAPMPFRGRERERERVVVVEEKRKQMGGEEVDATKGRIREEPRPLRDQGDKVRSGKPLPAASKVHRWLNERAEYQDREGN